MCGDHPCNCHDGLAIAQSGPKEVVIFGPASVEVPSEDQKLIRMSAIRAALPQLMKRRALTVLHKDQLVGEIRESVDVDPARATNPRARKLVEAVGGKFRTGVYPVTPEIAEAFPKLRTLVGKDQFFVAAVMHEDNLTSRLAVEEAKGGVLDSFSISGWTTKTEKVRHCDEQQCRDLVEVQAMDLSAVTLASSTGARESTFGARARNPGAGFLVVQQAQTPLSTPVHPGEAQESPGASEVAEASSMNPGAPETTPTKTNPGDALEQMRTSQVELTRRVETLEQAFAEFKGRATPPQAPAQPKDDKGKETEQAIAQAITPLVKTIEALVAKVGVLEQARTAGTVSTPAPAHPGKAPANDAMKGLVEAADRNDPAAFRTAFGGAIKSLRGGR